MARRVIATGAFLVLLGLAWAGEGGTSTVAPENRDTCVITLDRGQMEFISKASRGEALEMELTPEQAEAMHNAFPGWKGLKVMITPESVGEGGKVLFFRVGTDMEPKALPGRTEEDNPQPSP